MKKLCLKVRNLIIIQCYETYCIVLLKKKETHKCQLIANWQAIGQVKQFSYFGRILTSDGKCGNEIKRRIVVAKKASKNLANILRNRKNKLDIKKKY